jgi:hypothetical protein
MSLPETLFRSLLTKLQQCLCPLYNVASSNLSETLLYSFQHLPTKPQLMYWKLLLMCFRELKADDLLLITDNNKRYALFTNNVCYHESYSFTKVSPADVNTPQLRALCSISAISESVKRYMILYARYEELQTSAADITNPDFSIMSREFDLSPDSLSLHMLLNWDEMDIFLKLYHYVVSLFRDSARLALQKSFVEFVNEQLVFAITSQKWNKVTALVTAFIRTNRVDLVPVSTPLNFQRSQAPKQFFSNINKRARTKVVGRIKRRPVVSSDSEINDDSKLQEEKVRSPLGSPVVSSDSDDLWDDESTLQSVEVMTEPPVLVNVVYKVLEKLSKGLGGSSSGGAIYGEISKLSMNRIIRALCIKFGMNPSSHFLDVGSGLGKPCLHAAAYLPLQQSVGLELNGGRWYQSLHFLWHILSRGFVQCPVFFAHADATELPSFVPFTHVYMFDVGMPPETLTTIITNLVASPSVQCIVSYQKPDTIKKYGCPWRCKLKLPTAMSGSRSGHMAYFYRRPDLVLGPVYEPTLFTSNELALPCNINWSTVDPSWWVDAVQDFGRRAASEYKAPVELNANYGRGPFCMANGLTEYLSWIEDMVADRTATQTATQTPRGTPRGTALQARKKTISGIRGGDYYYNGFKCLEAKGTVGSILPNVFKTLDHCQQVFDSDRYTSTPLPPLRNMKIYQNLWLTTHFKLLGKVKRVTDLQTTEVYKELLTNYCDFFGIMVDDALVNQVTRESVFSDDPQNLPFLYNSLLWHCHLYVMALCKALEVNVVVLTYKQDSLYFNDLTWERYGSGSPREVVTLYVLEVVHSEGISIMTVIPSDFKIGPWYFS